MPPEEESKGIVDIKGCMQWQFDRNCWKVFYYNDQGVRCTTVKGLVVSRVDSVGQVLPLAEFRTNKERLYKEAQKIRDKLDQSSQERFAI